MKKHFIIILLAIFCFYAKLFSQEHVVFQHYSVQNGLSQNTVMAIIQDSKGFMWFGTWDGLNKFDGYEFTIYKSHPGDHSNIATNRIDFIHEDQFGYIWIQTYDGKMHRFNTKTEQFWSLPKSTNRFAYGVERERRFLETTTGEIWIATNDIGAIRIENNKKNAEPIITEYSTFSGNQIIGNSVNFVYEDSDKMIWLGTNNGLQSINTSTNQIKTYQPNNANVSNDFHSVYETNGMLWFGDVNGNVWYYSKDKNTFERIRLSEKTKITDIKAIHKNHLVLTTETAGVYIYNIANRQLVNFNKNNTASIQSNNFQSVKVDSYGIAWLETGQPGVFRYRLSDNSLKHFHPKTDAVSLISVMPNFIVIEDVNRNLWINPQGGGFSRYNRKNDQLEYFYNEPNSSNVRFSNVIHNAYADRKGNLWMCTYNKGLEKISFFTPQFTLGKVNKRLNTLTSNEVRAMLQLSNGNILIATKDGSIRVFDKKLNELGLLSKNGTLNSGDRISDLAYCFYEDSFKNIWIGTKGGGLYKLTPKNNDPAKPVYGIQQFKNNPLDNNSISSDNIYSIIEDAQNRILVGTFGGGLNIVNEQNGKISFISYRNQLSSYPINLCSKVRHLLLDHTNTLWIATTNGLLQIDNFNKAGTNEYYIEKMPNVENSLSNNDVHFLHEDKNNRLWLGTFGGGLSLLKSKATDKSPAMFDNYTSHDGMYNDIVLSIQEDKQGNLWLSSENSISRFNPETKFF